MTASLRAHTQPQSISIDSLSSELSKGNVSKTFAIKTLHTLDSYPKPVHLIGDRKTVFPVIGPSSSH